MLFLHNDNKSNSGQIGQVVAMGGSGKTKDFFLCFDPASLPTVELILCHERHHQLWSWLVCTLVGTNISCCVCSSWRKFGLVPLRLAWK